MTRPKLATAWLVAIALVLAGCSSGDSDAEPGADPPAGSAAPNDRGGGEPALDDPALDAALSEPVEDPVYPRVGDPGVDALHYDLDLAWTPDSSTLEGVETLVFRATTDADQFQLDLGEPLTVSELSVDGEPADFEEDGKDLVVRTPVEADRRYVLELHYSGTPRPVRAPTTRSDFDTLGWQVTDSRQSWTMQEPYGAFTWYAVNDQPSDKALYDFTISTPAPWVGVANGELVSQEDLDGDTVTRWHLDEPASSYLVTAAVGDYRMERDESASGVPITYWTERGNTFARERVRRTADLLGWIEDRLGPYPFSSLGVLVVDSVTGMETQTMLTLGDNDYVLSPAVILHELVHQWYGDRVTPRDWRDLWMSEGMTMYLQAVWEAEFEDVPLEPRLRDWAAEDQEMRDDAGPPADTEPGAFGEDGVYLIPALMWHELRERLGNDVFWDLVRRWPEEHDNDNASYDEITGWWSDQTGEDLQPFFDEWLLGATTPDRS